MGQKVKDKRIIDWIDIGTWKIDGSIAETTDRAGNTGPIQQMGFSRGDGRQPNLIESSSSAALSQQALLNIYLITNFFH